MFDVRRRWHRTLHPHITTTRSEDGYVLHLLIMYVEYFFKRPFFAAPVVRKEIRHESHTQALDLAGHYLCVVLCRTRLGRHGDLPQGPADPPKSRQRQRGTDLHRRPDSAGPAGMAVRRRAANGYRVGPRQLSRAGLVGRLAASRSPGLARNMGTARIRETLPAAGRGPAGATGQPAEG